MKLIRRLAAPLALAVAACAGQAQPAASHVGAPYKIKVDDAVREAASVGLVTTREAVIAPDCDAVTRAGASGLDALVGHGMAARLPANVTLYTTPYAPVGADSFPDVVTDDGYAGKLCTPHAFSPLK